MQNLKIIVIDDDPTGSQTVHSCQLLMRWDQQTLLLAFADQSPLFFVLSNTRAMSAAQAADITRDICRNIKQALATLQQQGIEQQILVVSRSDSTLRGHYPVETDVIAEELGPFDAHFMVPAFFEGGRITLDSTHYLLVDGEKVPVDQTEFAKDSVFAFSTAYLPDYVEEKTAGRIRADQVERFLLQDIKADLKARLSALSNNVCCVVDADQQSTLDSFAAQLLDVAAEQGKRFLFRSAASLLTSLANLPAQPVAADLMAQYVRHHQPGIILAGSHVKKTTEQIAYLLEHAPVAQVLIDVEHFKAVGCGEKTQQLDDYRQALVAEIHRMHQQGQDILIYTSRAELQFDDQMQRLAFGQALSEFLMSLVAQLPETIGYLISKGGITSNDVLSDGLALHAARVVGQILPGCSVIRCPSDHGRFADLPVVIFPGNVGDQSAVYQAFSILKKIANH